VSITNIHSMQSRSNLGISKPKHILSLATHSAESKPFSFKESVSNPKWKAAMANEFDALISNDT